MPAKQRKSLQIIIDTREQRPLPFTNEMAPGYEIEIVRTNLPAGDYSLVGHGGEADGAIFGISIERKADHDEIAANLGKHRDRFEREFHILAAYATRLVVIEEPHAALYAGQLRTRFDPRSLEASINAMAEKYCVPVFWHQSREETARHVLDALRRYIERSEHRKFGPNGVRIEGRYPPAIIDTRRYAQLIGRVTTCETIVAQLLADRLPPVPPEVKDQEPEP